MSRVHKKTAPVVPNQTAPKGNTKATGSSNMPPPPKPQDTWVTGDNGKSVFVPASEQGPKPTSLGDGKSTSTGPTVAVDFGSDWSEKPQGQLVAGGKLKLNYDIGRLSDLRNTHNGYPAWGITAYVKFEPSGKTSEGPVMSFKSNLGHPTNEPVGQALTVDIPAGTTGVQVWFKNWSGADSPREAYDSNYGNNYRFDVKS